MSKTYYTEKGWHIAAVEDPRNPSFNIVEITICLTGDTLVVTTGEYADIERSLSDIKAVDDMGEELILLDGEEFYGNVRDVLDPVIIYKIVD
jgi:hypothetical protein